MFSVVKDMRQGSSEWLEFRRKHITASDAGKILQDVPLSWGTPYTLWIDKLMGREVEVNARMLKGIELEPFARTAYNNQSDHHFDPAVVVSNDHPWMMASLDGLSRDRNHVVEFKCGESAFMKALNGEVASYYIPQLQHILAVTGCESIDYCCYWCDDLVIINVPRDEKYIKSLIEKEKEFYDCLVNHKEPDSALEDYIDESDSEEARMLRFKLENAIVKKKSLESSIQHYKDQLIQIANGRNIKIDGLKIRKKLRPGNIQYKDIPELSSVDLDSYRKEPTEFYTFIL